MTLKEIEELAGHRKVSPWVVKLVGDAVAKEREACAKVCQNIQDCGPENGCCPTYWNEALEKAEEAIRARGQE